MPVPCRDLAVVDGQFGALLVRLGRGLELVSWVTAGAGQLPAESLLLRRRFAVLRNLLCLPSAIAIVYLTPAYCD